MYAVNLITGSEAAGPSSIAGTAYFFIFHRNSTIYDVRRRGTRTKITTLKLYASLMIDRR